MQGVTKREREELEKGKGGRGGREKLTRHPGPSFFYPIKRGSLLKRKGEKKKTKRKKGGEKGEKIIYHSHLKREKRKKKGKD